MIKTRITPQLGNALELQNRIMYSFGAKVPELKGLFHTRKGSNQEEFGYYHSESVLPLDRLLRRIKKESIIDLGSGLCLLMAQLKLLGYKVGGIENERILVDNALIYPRPKFKSLLDLTKADLEGFECSYIWEPIIDGEKVKKFVERLVESTTPGHCIIYRSAGVTGSYLRGSRAFKRFPRLRYYNETSFLLIDHPFELYVRK